MGIKHHHIKESPCLHCSKSKKMASKAPSAMCCDPAADCCGQATCCTVANQCCPSQACCNSASDQVAYACQGGLPVVTRPAAVPRGHVGPAPVVVETRHAVKGLVDEQSAKHDKTQQSSKVLCMCRLYISNLHLWFVNFM